MHQNKVRNFALPVVSLLTETETGYILRWKAQKEDEISIS